MVVLFKEEHVPLILSGRKTQTRRIWSHGCRVKVGRTYQARTTLFGKPFAFIDVIKIEREAPCHISSEDVYAEGYDNHRDFYEVLRRVNPGIDLDQEVWVIHFIGKKADT